MKWLGHHIATGVVGVAVILIGDALLGSGTVDRWGQHAERLLGGEAGRIGDALATAWSGLVVVALAIACVLALLLAARICYGWLRGVAASLTRLMLRLKMDSYLTKDEALQVIAQSDFVRARDPGAKERSDLLAIPGLEKFRFGRSRRDAMVRRQFMKNMLWAFEEQRPDAVTDQGYHREALTAWLEELFAEEVRAEMGDIPKV